jgi:nitrate reductase NapE component
MCFLSYSGVSINLTICAYSILASQMEETNNNHSQIKNTMVLHLLLAYGLMCSSTTVLGGFNSIVYMARFDIIMIAIRC